MASPPNEESKELFRLLADMQWHPYALIKAEIAKKVPPGRALRKYQEDIESRRRALNDPSYDTTHNDDMRIELGARRVAQSAISSWSNKGILIEGKGEDKQMRIKPGFTSWGIPGFEPRTEPEAQDPSFEAGGYAEVPPAADEPSQVPTGQARGPVPSRKHLSDFVSRVLGGGEPGPIFTSGKSTAQQAAVSPAELEPPVAEPEPPVAEPEVPEEPTMEIPLEDESLGSHAASDYGWPELVSRECPECGATVGDWEAHELWHQGFVKRSEQPEMALLNESQLQELLGAAVGEALDRFQVGMQGYLETQFNQVNGALIQILTGVRRSKPHESWRSE